MSFLSGRSSQCAPNRAAGKTLCRRVKRVSKMATCGYDEAKNSADIAQLLWSVDPSQTVSSYDNLISSLGLHQQQNHHHHHQPSVHVHKEEEKETEPITVKRGRPRTNPQVKKQKKQTAPRVKKPRVCKDGVVSKCPDVTKSEKKRVAKLFHSMADICAKMGEICKEMIN
ncbi:uncharacterized protein LOC113217840 [Frankliniella occidentalis]|uniref:Uncharacterized protein LOC113217840 n=1 Tax=Frankliniella occidentalis TaxID=133901 RepID=A0A6J1TK56_FRAOC|nr:uncharacterized protein LOC113217840 [Frankliniella occidentalis]